MTPPLFVAVIPLLLVLAPLAHAQFVANPTNKTSATTNTTDPNYSTYQNLGLGFSINYLKNMTVSDKTDNRTGHDIYFGNPNGHLLMVIAVTPATSMLGLPSTLDDIVGQMILTVTNNNNTIITDKTKGNLNGLPAYKIGIQTIKNTGEVDTISYVTVKNEIAYAFFFSTHDKSNIQPIANKLIGTLKYN